MPCAAGESTDGRAEGTGLKRLRQSMARFAGKVYNIIKSAGYIFSWMASPGKISEKEEFFEK